MPSSVERSSSTSRSSSHRRHRSSHGSRSRSGRRRRRHRHNYRLNFKQAERNWIAAVFDLVVMAVLISALADQSWFRLHGGNCPAKSFGVLNFLFESFTPEERVCFDDQSTPIMRSIVAMLFLSVTTTLFAFTLDTLGPSGKILKGMRRYAVGNILTVIICVITCLLSFWAAIVLEDMLRKDPIAPTSRTVVTFDTGYFLMVMSGALSILISATNLLWPHPLIERPPRRERLVDDWEEFLEQDFSGIPPTFNVSVPPPEYTP
ncbi:putative transmembrane protein [Apostichopus japonicus]|uniref:Putative transmembrane protein n=1 Tax=Stichopus japonicus TaxID=307972 RepID=A0A2G8LNU5_STIJA|nr:putative transmembrane protein [Apostichopus japonicus]